MHQFFNTSVTPRARVSSKQDDHFGQKKMIVNVNKTFQVADKSLANTTIDRTLHHEGSTPVLKHTERRYKHLNYEQIKKHYLIKVLINRALNTRLTIKKME